VSTKTNLPKCLVLNTSSVLRFCFKTSLTIIFVYLIAFFFFAVTQTFGCLYTRDKLLLSVFLCGSTTSHVLREFQSIFVKQTNERWWHGEMIVHEKRLTNDGSAVRRRRSQFIDDVQKDGEGKQHCHAQRYPFLTVWRKPIHLQQSPGKLSPQLIISNSHYRYRRIEIENR